MYIYIYIYIYIIIYFVFILRGCVMVKEFVTVAFASATKIRFKDQHVKIAQFVFLTNLSINIYTTKYLNLNMHFCTIIVVKLSFCI